MLPRSGCAGNPSVGLSAGDPVPHPELRGSPTSARRESDSPVETGRPWARDIEGMTCGDAIRMPAPRWRVCRPASCRGTRTPDHGIAWRNFSCDRSRGSGIVLQGRIPLDHEYAAKVGDGRGAFGSGVLSPFLGGGASPDGRCPSSRGGDGGSERQSGADDGGPESTPAPSDVGTKHPGSPASAPSPQGLTSPSLRSGRSGFVPPPLDACP